MCTWIFLGTGGADLGFVPSNRPTSHLQATKASRWHWRRFLRRRPGWCRTSFRRCTECDLVWSLRVQRVEGGQWAGQPFRSQPQADWHQELSYVPLCPTDPTDPRTLSQGYERWPKRQGSQGGRDLKRMKGVIYFGMTLHSSFNRALRGFLKHQAILP